MKLKELLSVVSDDLGDVIINFSGITVRSNGLSSQEVMSHLDDDVLEIYIRRNKLRIQLDNPSFPNDPNDCNIKEEEN